ncbi:MAG: YlxM family DNA-binding protein [Heliobacteriaceae bacterium]|nr:YlxM family DNA-binding protein [Heliobacteriaceae bacterium]MDD4587023.1 YlxM family DNA-binding protein [Heliobacteriaceae bacterium]
MVGSPEDRALAKLKRVALLYDFYGQLLTERQRQVIALYYEDNWSLGEIADALKVSRQAIFDLLRRAEKSLNRYEEKLALVKRWERERHSLTKIVAQLEVCYNDKDFERLANLIACLAVISETGGEIPNGHV